MTNTTSPPSPSRRKRPPGRNDRERQRYLLAQQRLRNFAREGLTLEVDADGAPMPYSTDTVMRSPSDPYTLPTTLSAIKIKSPRTLGQAVRLWRRRCKLARKTIATAAGLTPRSVFDLEAGKPGVRIGSIVRTLDELGLELLVRPKRPVKRLYPERLYKDRRDDDPRS